MNFLAPTACPHCMCNTRIRTQLQSFHAGGLFACCCVKVLQYCICDGQPHCFMDASSAQAPLWDIASSFCIVSLDHTCRWCLTGTPVCTDILDLHGQFNVLRLDPFRSQAAFIKHASLPYGRSTAREHSAALLLYTLSKCMIRHTKDQVGKSLIIRQISKDLL